MPVIQLNTVVFPAPLGPIKEAIVPSSTRNDSALTAMTPPKACVNSCTSSSPGTLCPPPSQPDGRRKAGGGSRSVVRLPSAVCRPQPAQPSSTAYCLLPTAYCLLTRLRP